MRTKTISRLRRAALATAAAAVLVAPARGEELEGPSRLAAPSQLEGPSRVEAPVQPEGPARVEAPAKVAAPAKRKRARKVEAPATAGAAAAMEGPSRSSEPAQPQEPVARGETQPQRVVQPERVVQREGPEGRLVMPKSAEEKGMQIQPDTPEIYVIVKGDTLWDLSQKFLNNPWYWPKIWSLNAYIENPHWIYPGNKLKIIPGQGGPQAPAQVEQAPEPMNEERPQSEIANQVDTTPPEAADLAVVRQGSREFDQSSSSVSISGKLAFKPPAVLSWRDSGLVSPEEMRLAGIQLQAATAP